MDEHKEIEEADDYHENVLPINLPQAFRDLKFAKRMAIDIGKHKAVTKHNAFIFFNFLL